MNNFGFHFTDSLIRVWLGPKWIATVSVCCLDVLANQL